VQEPKRLSGQVAVVTGASSGLGRAAAVALAAAGASVAALARSEADLEETVRQIEAARRNALGAEFDGANTETTLAVPIDLADADAIAEAMEQIRQELGPVDILVNAAGTDVPGSVEELDVAGWDRVLNVNLRAVFLLSQAVFPDMRRNGGGTIITIGSVAGRRGWANAAAYCSSKFALTGLTQTLAAEGKPYSIRASLLYPGAMDTSWGAWQPEDRDNEDGKVPTAAALPAEHVAELIAWIAQAPPDMVLNEVTVTPLLEAGWP
jgi:NAD(P)-dependent dehydrogenase (short-subunit alcohol dehydrogenase family)